MRIYLIRHGQTTNNVCRILDSNPPGAHLSDLGREQAAGLVGAFDGVHLDAIYVSSLRRTGETAEPLALSRGIDPVELDGLREIEAGSWEGGSDESTYRGYLGTVQQWLSGRLEERMGGGVTGADVLERYDAAIGSIEASGAHTAAAVSHGAAIGFWTCMRASGIDSRAVERALNLDVAPLQVLKNGQMCVIEGDLASGYRVVSWNGAPPGESR